VLFCRASPAAIGHYWIHAGKNFQVSNPAQCTLVSEQQ